MFRSILKTLYIEHIAQCKSGDSFSVTDTCIRILHHAVLQVQFLCVVRRCLYRKMFLNSFLFSSFNSLALQSVMDLDHFYTFRQLSCLCVTVPPSFRWSPYIVSGYLWFGQSRFHCLPGCPNNIFFGISVSLIRATCPAISVLLLFLTFLQADCYTFQCYAFSARFLFYRPRQLFYRIYFEVSKILRSLAVSSHALRHT